MPRHTLVQLVAVILLFTAEQTPAQHTARLPVPYTVTKTHDGVNNETMTSMMFNRLGRCTEEAELFFNVVKGVHHNENDRMTLVFILQVVSKHKQEFLRPGAHLAIVADSTQEIYELEYGGPQPIPDGRILDNGFYPLYSEPYGSIKRWGSIDSLKRIVQASVVEVEVLTGKKTIRCRFSKVNLTRFRDFFNEHVLAHSNP